MDLEQRVIELESRQAFQDDTIAALNDVVVEQQQIIERLKLQVAALARRQEEIQGQFGIAEDEAPPPHY
jgi:SlyX protein